MNSAQLLLNKSQIEQKINRIAYQILEDNLDEKEIVLAGMWQNGYKLALRLEKVLQKIASFNIVVVKVILNEKRTAVENSEALNPAQWKDKVIILVDDVLNSGKTLASGLSIFLNTNHKKIRTVVLVDRSHKSFPIATDFVGLQLATVLKEHIDVVLDAEKEEDKVYLS